MPRTLGQAAGFLLGFWIALWLSPLSVRAAADADTSPFAELEAALHSDVNQVRGQRHLIPLTRRPELDAVARAHSLDMAQRAYLAHEAPEGGNAVTRLHASDVSGFTLAAENIGFTSRTDANAEVLNGWLQSEIHRTNLFAPPFNATGIGIARTAAGALIYPQLYVTYPR
jgi:uncharacterized protein YkwD